MEKVPMTIEGFKKLEAELHRLKVEERPRIIQQISEARDHGDLSENAEYHAAKDAQGLNEAKVAELEDKIARAEVIDPAKLSGSTVKFGATVTLEDEDSGDKVKYKIVGEHEADRTRGQDLHHLAYCACTDRQVERRERRGDDPEGDAQLRDPKGRVQVGGPRSPATFRASRERMAIAPYSCRVRAVGCPISLIRPQPSRHTFPTSCGVMVQERPNLIF